MQIATETATAVTPIIVRITSEDGFPRGISRAGFIDFLVRHLDCYGDPPEDISAAIDYAFSDAEGKGGFLLAATIDGALAGAMVVIDTGMGSFIPEHILVYVAVDAEQRGLGIGTRLMNAMREACHGDVALHVEYDNPARRLYERLGFTTKYAEMRLHR